MLPIKKPAVAALPPRERKARLEKRRVWMQQVDWLEAFDQLFNLLPDLYFFAKNQRSEIMYFSKSILDNFRIQDESEVIGMTDFDLTPSEVSKGYRAQDAAVLSSGKPVINRVELWFNRQGLPDWYVANKFPVRSRSGKIVGVIGFLQPSRSRQQRLPLPATLVKAIQFIESAYAQPLSMKQLASQAGVSVRQLERQFKVFFGIHPSEFLTKTRVKAAAQLLWQTDQKLVAVALACGFTDQSALSRSFKKHVGLTPRQFRRLSLGTR